MSRAMSLILINLKVMRYGILKGKALMRDNPHRVGHGDVSLRSGAV